MSKRITVLSGLNRLVNVVGRLSAFGATAASILIIAMTLLVLVEIVLRTGCGQTILIAEEYVAYAFACLGFWGLAYTLRTEGHIRVRIILSRLSSRKRAYLNLICLVVCLFLFIYLSFQMWGLLYSSLILGTVSMSVSRTPLCIPQFFLFAGCVLMVLQLATNTIASVVSLLEASTNKIELPKAG